MDLSQAKPTFAHDALKILLDQGVAKHIISQNVDGLHRRSGVNPSQLSELHGNTNLEHCKKCGAEYLRDFNCRRPGNHVHDHTTGRLCENKGCGGKLYDSIINFGENLPEKAFASAEVASKHADLMIVLGSSCKVTPAADLPESIGRKNRVDPQNKPRLVIVNLQRTPLDGLATLKIHGRTDQVMRLLLEQLTVSSSSSEHTRLESKNGLLNEMAEISIQ